MIGIYLGSGEGSLDFDAYTNAALAGWKPDVNDLDFVKWAQIAMEMMNVMREVDQAYGPLESERIVTTALAISRDAEVTKALEDLKKELKEAGATRS